nr:EOG090X02ZJ [Eulimnadia texana]
MAHTTNCRRSEAFAVLFLRSVLLLVSLNFVASRPNLNSAPTWESLVGDSSAISRRNPSTSEMLRQHLRQALSKCNSREPPPMQKILLQDQRAVCNDGSPAGYYVRKSYGSQRWIVFLDGGWYCVDKRSCDDRWTRLRGLMTSAMWPDTRQVGGILSPDPEENPFWWNANHVYVPYCSSDSWSGSSPAGTNNRFAFMGSSIIREVLRDLLPQGLSNASKLILTGSSAGGIGVLLNLDRAAEFLRSHGSSAEVRGISDSGWFLDNVPYAPADCYDPARCAPLTAVQLGYNLWNAQVPESCRNQYPSQPWRCFFGHHLYRTLRTPLFVFQWLFDEAQMTANNVGPPMSKEQWDYIHAVGDDLRRSLSNVTAFFTPSCISHTVLTKRDWQTIRVGEITLPQALRCWELQPAYAIANHHPVGVENNVAVPEIGQQHPLRHAHKRLKSTHLQHSPVVLLADDPELSSSVQGSVKPARNLVRSAQHRESVGFNGTILKPARNSTRRNGEKRKVERRKKLKENREKKEGRKRKNDKEKGKRERLKNNREKNKAVAEVRNRPKRAESSKSPTPEFCQHRVTDRCSWPQCNRMCPKLHNPFTGEEMDFIQLLKSFGLDMSSVANALGIDMHTLNNMDHDVLLHLLTQQTT